MLARRTLATCVTMAGLFLVACGDDGGGSGGGGTTGITGTTGSTGTTGAVEQTWTATISSFLEASNDYARYYRAEYRGPFPSDADTDEEKISYLTDIQNELLNKLAAVEEVHELLDPALEHAIEQDAITLDQVTDLREFVDVTGRWLAIQRKVAEGGLDCLESEGKTFDRIKVCALKLAVEYAPETDQLAARIDELAGELFGSA